MQNENSKNSVACLEHYPVIGIIEDYVSGCFPMNKDVQQVMNTIDYRHPDRPDDDSIRYIAFDAGPGKPRMKIGTVRYLTRKCKLSSILNDILIRDLALKINSTLWGVEELNEIELLSGTAIMQAYSDKVGGHSCMTGGCSDYVGLYASNPDRFQLIVARNDNDSARAVVSKLDNGEYYMDTIYTTAEHLKEVLKSYAREHGWWFSYGNYPANSIMNVSGLEYEDGAIPYMDTFTSGSVCSGLLDIGTRGGDYELASTCGELEGGYVCEDCGCHVSQDDIMSDGQGYYYCETCWCERFFYCESCDSESDRDDSVCIEDEQKHVCQNCADSHYYQCEHCRQYNSIDATQEVEGDIVCEDCIDKAGFCEDCSEYFYNENLETWDYDTVCRDCGGIRQDEIEAEKEAEIQAEKAEYWHDFHHEYTLVTEAKEAELYG